VSGVGDGAQQAGAGRLLGRLVAELSIGALGVAGAQSVAERVDAQALDRFVEGEAVATAGRHLLTGQGQVVVGHHLVRGLPALPGAEEEGRQEDGVEEQVVLADEVSVQDPWVLPPRLPRFGTACFLGPFPGGGEVADDGIEPDVEPPVLPAGQWHRHSPGQVPGDGPGAQAQAEDAASLLGHEYPPSSGRPLDVGGHLGLEAIQGKEHLAERPEGGGRPAAPAAGRAQVFGVKCAPAGVALVAPSVWPGAGRADPLHVAVRQRPALDRAPRRLRRRLIDEPPAVEVAEDLLDHLVMGGRRRAGVVIEADPDPLEARHDGGVLAVGEDGGGLACRLGGDSDGRAVLVRAGDHEHLVAGQAVVASDDVGR